MHSLSSLIELLVTTFGGVSVVVIVVLIGWSIVWKCILSQIPFVREIFGLPKLQQSKKSSDKSFKRERSTSFSSNSSSNSVSSSAKRLQRKQSGNLHPSNNSPQTAAPNPQSSAAVSRKQPSRRSKSNSLSSGHTSAEISRQNSTSDLRLPNINGLDIDEDYFNSNGPKTRKWRNKEVSFNTD